MLLRLALGLAERIVSALPANLAYALADTGGRVWYRSPHRRRLVAANLARVCTATGRAASGPAFERLVRRAFREHARYYLELLRGPSYPLERIGQLVTVRDWERHEATLRSGPTVLVGAHLGNFEPMGAYFAAHGIPVLSPIEEIRPPALFEFLRSRRGTGRGVEVVPLSKARRPMIAMLRRGGAVGLIADRDLAGDGLPVTFFGHPTTLPEGPAALVVMSDAAFLAGYCLRLGPDRFDCVGEPIEVERTGDRRTDVQALTRAMGETLERQIARAPEQWWGAFQPIWPDLGRAAE
jgi:KDO2-lipid IV(A) lauroyltransferase